MKYGDLMNLTKKNSSFNIIHIVLWLLRKVINKFVTSSNISRHIALLNMNKAGISICGICNLSFVLWRIILLFVNKFSKGLWTTVIY